MRASLQPQQPIVLQQRSSMECLRSTAPTNTLPPSVARHQQSGTRMLFATSHGYMCRWYYRLHKFGGCRRRAGSSLLSSNATGIRALSVNRKDTDRPTFAGVPAMMLQSSAWLFDLETDLVPPHGAQCVSVGYRSLQEAYFPGMLSGSEVICSWEVPLSICLPPMRQLEYSPSSVIRPQFDPAPEVRPSITSVPDPMRPPAKPAPTMPPEFRPDVSPSETPGPETTPSPNPSPLPEVPTPEVPPLEIPFDVPETVPTPFPSPEVPTVPQEMPRSPPSVFPSNPPIEIPAPNPSIPEISFTASSVQLAWAMMQEPPHPILVPPSHEVGLVHEQSFATRVPRGPPISPPNTPPLTPPGVPTPTPPPSTAPILPPGVPPPIPPPQTPPIPPGEPGPVPPPMTPPLPPGGIPPPSIPEFPPAPAPGPEIFPPGPSVI